MPAQVHRILSSSIAARALAALLIAVVPAIAVYEIAWVSDDAFITLRYASNVLAGHGPVFNVGEHVQGYTHPLWLAFLTVALWVVDDPVYAATGLGLAFTVLGITAAAFGLISVSANRFTGALIATVLAALFVSSEAWRSFQTSGLENSLTNLWIVLLVWLVVARPTGAYLALASLISLAWLTRPDLAVLLIPLAAVTLYQAWREKRVGLALAGFVPAIAWLVFAQLYYGEFLPNTADAKVGLFESRWDGIQQGIRYVEDWVRHEPLSAAASVAALVAAAAVGRGLRERALLVGVGLSLLYVIFVGGDFMRGRFMLTFFVSALTLGAFSVAARVALEPFSVRNYSVGFAGAASLALIFVLFLARPSVNGELSQDGIGNERVFYRGMSLQSYRANGEVQVAFYELDWIRKLRQYADTCGPTTIHTATVGVIGYYVGDEVNIIDSLGLTDDFIADLPEENMMRPIRVGHPFKYIPVSYLAQNGDISLFEGWDDAILERDCGFKEVPKRKAASDELAHPLEPIPPE